MRKHCSHEVIERAAVKVCARFVLQDGHRLSITSCNDKPLGSISKAHGVPDITPCFSRSTAMFIDDAIQHGTGSGGAQARPPLHNKLCRDSEDGQTLEVKSHFSLSVYGVRDHGLSDYDRYAPRCQGNGETIVPDSEDPSWPTTMQDDAASNSRGQPNIE